MLASTKVIEDIFAVVVACAIVLGLWGVIAIPVGYLVHRRMIGVERERGIPAQPKDEYGLFWFAISCSAWPVSIFVALVTVINRAWSRLGRNTTWVFLAQISASVIASSFVAGYTVFFPSRARHGEVFPLALAASGMLGLGTIITTTLLWIWAGKRADRLSKDPPTQPSPGWWRYLLYLGSLCFFPLGIILTFVFQSAHDARVGANAFRCSLIHVQTIVLAVCVAFPMVLPVVVRWFVP